MTTDLRGIPLLDAAIEEIKADPRRHDQVVYAERTPCGSAFCVAGLSVVLAYGEDSIRWSTGVDWGDGRITAHACEVPGRDRPVLIATAAAELLGLNSHEADWLFSAGNTLTDIEVIRDALAREGVSA